MDQTPSSKRAVTVHSARMRSGRLAVAAAVAAAFGVSTFGVSTPAFATTTTGGAFSGASFAAGGMSDTTVGLDGVNKVYQNTANVNGPLVTVAAANPVDFAAGGLTSGTNWTLTGATASFPGPNGNTGGIAAGGLKSVVDNFTYNGNPGVLTLSGLTVGQTYSFTHYAAGFGTTRVMSQITGTSGTDVGAAYGINEDAAGTGNGALLRYTFVAQAATVALSFTPADTGNTWHFYGFTNEQVFNRTYVSGTLDGGNYTGQSVSGAGSNAILPAQASPTTVTVSAPTTVGHLQFVGTNGYTLSGAAITLAADVGGASALYTVDPTTTHTISADVNLSTDLVKLGPGTLNITGAFNNNGKGVTVNGVLRLPGATVTSTFNGPIGIYTDNGLLFQPGGTGALGIASLTGTGNFTLADTGATPFSLTVGVNNGSGSYSGVLSSGSTLTKVGTGTQELRGANTFPGITTINGGILRVAVLGAGGTASGLGTSGSAASSVVINGGVLGYGGAAASSTDRRFTIGVNGAGLESSGAGAITFTDTSPLVFSTTSSQTFSLGGTNTGANTLAAVVTDSGTSPNITTVVKNGTGRWVLSGLNTYTGPTTINAGTLTVNTIANGGSPSGLGSSSNAATNLVFNSGAVLSYAGSAATTTDRRITVAGNGFGLDSSGTGAVAFTDTGALTYTGAASARGLTLSGTNTGLNTLAAAVNDTGTGANITTVTKTGAGTWALSGASNYTGETVFGGGVLNVSALTDYGVNGPLGARAAASDTTATVGFHFTGGTLQYTGSTPTSTNRNIRVNLSGATFDASGTVPSATMSFTHTGPNVNLFDTGGVRTFTLTGTNTGNNSFGILLENQGASVTNLTKSGAGKWVLPTPDNTYGGVTTFAGGTLNVASVSNYGVNSSVGNRLAASEVAGSAIGFLFQGGTLQYTGSTPQSTNRQIRVSTNGGAFIDASGSTPSATLNFTFNGTNTDFFENAGTRQVTFTGTNTGNNTFAISIINQAANATTVNKTGAGTWVLTGASTYTGPTTITGGTLAVGLGGTGSTSGSAITAQSGGTLAGSGTITGSVAVNLGGQLAPGNSIGTLTVTGPVTFGTAGAGAVPTYVAELGPGNTTDLLAVSGLLTLSNPDVLNLVTSNTGTFKIATFGTLAGTFDTVQINGVPGVAGSNYTIAYNANDITVNVTAVPEPASLALLGFGAAGLLASRRRPRRPAR